jgi:hypothetical protein
VIDGIVVRYPGIRGRPVAFPKEAIGIHRTRMVDLGRRARAYAVGNFDRDTVLANMFGTDEVPFTRIEVRPRATSGLPLPVDDRRHHREGGGPRLDCRRIGGFIG